MLKPAILAPLLAQVALTFGLVATLGLMRLRSALRGQVRLEDIALDNRGWPQRAKQVGNSYANQFELPVLFYLLCVLLMLPDGPVPALQVGLAWAFVATRYVHAFIHVTTNRVTHRFYVFTAGVWVLFAMWVLFALQWLGGLAAV